MANTPGNGSLVKVTITGTPTTIGQLVSFSGPNATAASIDTTGLATTAKTSIAGMPDWGDFSFVANLDHSDTTHAKLITSFNAGTIDTWGLYYADTNAATVTFSGHITSLTFAEAAVDNIVRVNCTVKVTAAPTVTP